MLDSCISLTYQLNETAMTYFIRFTETIEADIKRNTSILTNHNNEVVEGLCAFFGDSTIEESHAKAKRLGKSVAEVGDSYAIVEANEVWDSKKGTLGTVIENCILVAVGKI